MADEKPNKENEVTPEGAVEIKEEDLDQASGGAGFLKVPVDRLTGEGAVDGIKLPQGDGSVKPADFTMKPGDYDLKKI